MEEDNNQLEKGIIGLCGEYAVASEICRRGHYAQITLGNLKSTDILVFNPDSKKMIRIEVKSKQGKEWPNIKGIKDDNILIVFVDFQEKDLFSRPDFYILNNIAWFTLVDTLKTNPSFAGLEDDYIPLWKNRKTGELQGKYKGCGIKPNMINEYKEKWDILLDKLL